MENKDNFICIKCKNYRLISIGCDAFPDGIPNEILFNNNHDKPLKDQDNTIVFEEGEPKME
jgi:hypothetical protein